MPIPNLEVAGFVGVNGGIEGRHGTKYRPAVTLRGDKEDLLGELTMSDSKEPIKMNILRTGNLNLK